MRVKLYIEKAAFAKGYLHFRKGVLQETLDRR